MCQPGLAVWAGVSPLHLTRPLTDISRRSTFVCTRRRLARCGAVGSGVYARSRARCDMPRGHHQHRPGQPGSSFWWAFSHETMLCCPVCTQDVCLAPARSGPHSVPMPRVGNSFRKQARTFSLCSRPKPGRLFHFPDSHRRPTFSTIRSVGLSNPVRDRRIQSLERKRVAFASFRT